MDIPEINLPDTDYILVPPKTIFYPPVAEEPYLDPILLPSLEQVESGLGDQGSSAEEDKASSKEEELQLTSSGEISLVFLLEIIYLVSPFRLWLMMLIF